MLVPREDDRAEQAGRRRIVVLGSTGSIGKSALEVIKRHPERFEVVGLAAGSNAELLLEQIADHRPRRAVIRDERALEDLRSRAPSGVRVDAGPEALCELCAEGGADMVLAAIVGMAGLAPVLSSLAAGVPVALANKESLVCGGRMVEEAARKGGAAILPVDSEHSAIFQALQGERDADVSSLILTASGGPFLRTPLSELHGITPAQAVKHPRWSMGAKISVDSATMMNKALEVIEAHWLFGFGPGSIEVLVHPQSIVHSLIRLIDGTQMAQLSLPDMKGAIAYALTYPRGRLDRITEQLDLARVGALEFSSLDPERFPAVALAKSCLEAGGNSCAVFNIANEVAVSRFLSGALGFTGIVPFVAEALGRHGGGEVSELAELLELEREISMTPVARGRAHEPVMEDGSL